MLIITENKIIISVCHNILLLVAAKLKNKILKEGGRGTFHRAEGLLMFEGLVIYQRMKYFLI